MGKRIYTIDTVTQTAFADTTALTNAAYIGSFKGGSGTQRTLIDEIIVNGQAAAAAVVITQLARESTVGVGAQSGGDDAALDPATAALAAPVGVGNSFATSAPQRDVAAKLHHLTINAFGGISKWKSLAADRSDSPVLLGNTASFGGMSLSAFTGSAAGAVDCHVIYETL
jgi:hypothetical protein